MPRTARKPPAVPPCTCRAPDPETTWEEHFEGLFQDAAAATFDVVSCKTCRGVIRDWAPCAPLERDPAPVRKRPKGRRKGRPTRPADVVCKP